MCHVEEHFDSRGTNGQEPGWVLYFTLAAEEMGREAGTGGEFVMPTAGSYAYTLPAAVAGPVVKNKNEDRPFMKNEADPVRSLLGSGRLSHPQEWADTISMFKREGVEVSYREGVMAYWAKEGEPGRIIIDPDCSISALWHEAQHFLDDKALGTLPH